MKLLKKLLANQRGMILVLSLLILALLIGAGVGAIVSMQTDFRSSGNLKTGTQAFYNADAGVNHARQELQDSDSPHFDSIFTAADGTVIVSNSSFNGGTYSVTRQGSASSPSRIKVLSVGTAPNNARAELEVWFRKDDGRPPKAVETNGDLEISGNPNIMGTCGGAHANEDMRIQGNPGIQMANGLTVSNQTVTNRGIDIANGMDISGNPCVGSSQCSLAPGQQPDANRLDTATERDNYESANNSAALQDIPTINPADYAQKVANLGAAGNGYICRQSGQVQQGGTCDATTGLCSGGTVVSAPSGWSCSSGNWQVSGNSAANGVFYSEGQTKISGSPGSTANPLQATIIARDSIEISGTPNIKPYPTSSDELKNHLLVTGNDLKISGNMKANYEKGAILVHQQFEISGNPEIAGFIISGDGLPTWTGDPFGPSQSNSGVTVNRINGNPTITYACDFGCTGPGCPPPTVGTASWAQKF